MWNFPLFPESASTTAAMVDPVYLAILGFSVFFSLAICIVIVWFAIKYRRGSRADRSNPADESPVIEVIWITIPTIIGLGLFVWATVIFFHIYNPPAGSFEVSVVGLQWMWKLQHPEGKQENNELHVPVGQPVRLKMISQDVIHSFFIPAFRIKQDVLPGRYTSVWFHPTKVGEYHLFCAEYCGTNHSRMIGTVYVQEPSDYQRWLQAGTGGESMSTRGARLFRQYGCSGCHLGTAAVRAPALEGVYGKPVPIQNRKEDPVTFVTADDRYIRDSILLPKSQVVAGFEPLMPTFAGRVSEEDLLHLIAYIKSLGTSERTSR